MSGQKVTFRVTLGEKPTFWSLLSDFEYFGVSGVPGVRAAFSQSKRFLLEGGEDQVSARGGSVQIGIPMVGRGRVCVCVCVYVSLSLSRARAGRSFRERLQNFVNVLRR